MNRRNILIGMVVVLAASATAQIARWDLKPTEHGSLTIYKFFACEDWRYPSRGNDLDTPNRGPSWPLLCDTNGNADGLTILYWRKPTTGGDERFCTMSGAPRQPPIRWAYIRLSEDTWTGVNYKPSNDGAVAEKAPNLDSTMRWLASFGFSKKAVMDAMDRVTWTDSTGAPE